MPGILIIAPNWIGDAVMTQPLLAKLQSQFPNSTIDVLASSWVAPIYRACAQVNEVIEAQFTHRQLQWALRKQLAKDLQAKQYQFCFVLPNSFKSALIPWLANIPLRIGYRGELRYGLINLALSNPSKTNRPPMAQHYLALADVVANMANDSDPSRSTDFTQQPQLKIQANAQKRVEQKLQDKTIDPATTYVLCPGAEYGPTKRWPTEHFAALTNAILDQDANHNVILLGGPGDKALANQIIQLSEKSDRLHDWCGTCSLDESIALIGLCKAVVSNDSGLMHIAAALKTPQVAIFGSSDPKHTPPLSDKAKVIWLHLPCSPCHQRECPLGHLNCLKEIEPQQVLATLNTL